MEYDVNHYFSQLSQTYSDCNCTHNCWQFIVNMNEVFLSMAIFVFGYDLVNEQGSSADYQELWDELERLGAHRIQESLWVVNLDNTAKEVVDHFKNFVDDNDRLWASVVTPRQYHYVGAKAGTNNWFSSNN